MPESYVPSLLHQMKTAQLSRSIYMDSFFSNCSSAFSQVSSVELDEVLSQGAYMLVYSRYTD
jgi:hypothetical protein